MGAAGDGEAAITSSDEGRDGLEGRRPDGGGLEILDVSDLSSCWPPGGRVLATADEGQLWVGAGGEVPRGREGGGETTVDAGFNSPTSLSSLSISERPRRRTDRGSGRVRLTSALGLFLLAEVFWGEMQE